ncbi:MAG: ribose 5-phosphate isomerase B [Candidatus Solibacter sp.]|jgi:ribose 5-phosphate isomerase B
MKIAIGADHAGFSLKEQLRLKLAGEGYEVVDFGTDSPESCDYPDFAQSVGRDVAQGRSDRGILVCSTGIGMAMAANKVDGVRAAPAESEDEVKFTRQHNDANVLTLGAKYLDAPRAMELIDIFLNTEFAGGRHARRVAKIAQMEK